MFNMSSYMIYPTIQGMVFNPGVRSHLLDIREIVITDIHGISIYIGAADFRTVFDPETEDHKFAREEVLIIRNEFPLIPFKKNVEIDNYRN